MMGQPEVQFRPGNGGRMMRLEQLEATECLDYYQMWLILCPNLFTLLPESFRYSHVIERFSCVV